MNIYESDNKIPTNYSSHFLILNGNDELPRSPCDRFQNPPALRSSLAGSPAGPRRRSWSRVRAYDIMAMGSFSKPVATWWWTTHE